MELTPSWVIFLQNFFYRIASKTFSSSQSLKNIGIKIKWSWENLENNFGFVGKRKRSKKCETRKNLFLKNHSINFSYQFQQFSRSGTKLWEIKREKKLLRIFLLIKKCREHRLTRSLMWHQVQERNFFQIKKKYV